MKNYHNKYMKLALSLAKKGSPRVYPNPLVGCVIVKNGKIIARGYHEYFGGPHAEINALRQAGKKASGADLYVTLEPCNHWGKTPPCSDEIIRAGIKHVIIAMHDPNPKTSGQSIKKLKNKGISVTQNILKKQSENINKDFIKHTKNRKPHVILKMAMSLDGKIATKTGDSKWISGPKARKFVHKLRSQMNGIVVGVNTVIKDNPDLSSHGRGNNPVRIIIDPNLRIPINSRVLNGEIPCIIIYSKKLKVKLKQLAKKPGVTLVHIQPKQGTIDFKNILNIMHKYEIYKVLIEGGGETAAAALNAGIVNELFMVIVPKIIGGRDAKSPVEGPGIDKVSKAIELKNPKITKIGKDFIITTGLPRG